MQIKGTKFVYCKSDVNKTYITTGAIAWKIFNKIRDIKCIKR